MKTDDLRDRDGKFEFKPREGELRYQRFLIVVLISLIGLFASNVRAAFSDNFDSLLAELQTLAPTLEGSTDKTAQKQYKAVIKVIAAINKPSTSLATDLKTATKIAGEIQKEFPDDPTLSNLTDGVFAGILSDTTDDLDALQEAAAALPTGTAQTKALAAVALAQTALTAAEAASDPKSLSSALGRVFKSIAAGDKDLISKSGSGGGGSGGGSGGGGGGGQYFKANIGGKSFTAKILSVTNALGHSDELALSGATSVFHSVSDYDFQQLSIGFINFSGTGTYYGDDTPDTDFEFYYFHNTATANEQWDTYIGGGSGSVTITSYNSTAGTAAGNFDITVVNDETEDSMEISGTFSLQGAELEGY
jgi:hypothetical protein